MPQNYTPEFKKKIVRLRPEEGRTIKSITTEYSISKETIRRWCNELKEECRTGPDTETGYDNMKEMLKLKRENEELRKENLFLKKAAAFFAKETGQRLTGLSNGITGNPASAGCSGGLASARMLITTAGNTGRRMIMPKKRR